MILGHHDSVRAAVLHRLDVLDRAAGHADAGILLSMARVELNRLANGWRVLLTVHQRDDEGRCRSCRPGLRGRRWPCEVWLMAHEQLIGEGVPHRRRTRPLRNPFGRPPKARRAAPESEPERTVSFPSIRNGVPQHARG
jgi:hypothetical protein